MVKTTVLSYDNSMGLLTKIFNFDKEKLESLEFRNNSRFRPNDQFPLMVAIAIKKRFIPTKIQNISKGGLALSLPTTLGKVPFSKGDVLNLEISLFEHKTKLTGKVSHCHGDRFGIELEHNNLTALIDYHQLIYPILIGRSMSEHPSSTSTSFVYVGMEETKMTFHKNDQNILEKVHICLTKDKLSIIGTAPTPIKLQFFPNGQLQIPLKNNDEKFQDYFQFYKWFLLHLDPVFPADQLNFLKNVSVHP